MTGCLARLVTDPNMFVNEYWCRRPVHSSGSSDVARFDHLVCVADVIDVVGSPVLRPPYLRVVQAGGRAAPAETWTGDVRIGRATVTDGIRPDRLLSEMRAGSTLVLDGGSGSLVPRGRFAPVRWRPGWGPASHRR